MKAHYYKIIETSLGFCLIIFKTNPFILTKIFLPLKNKEDLKFNIEDGLTEKTEHHEKTDFVCNEINNYFSKGYKIKIPIEWLDFSGISEFEKKVLFRVYEIPFGKTASYKEIAESINNPEAARAVGNVMAKNRFPIIVPCHRVIKTDGSLGKFGGGTDMKKRMLEIEGYYV